MRVWDFFRRIVHRGRPSKQERLEEIKRRVEEAKEALRADHDEWEIWRGYYDGTRQMDAAAPLTELELQGEFISSNFIFSSTENYVSSLLRALEQPFVVEEGEQTEHAKKATAWLRAYGKQKNMPGLLEMTFRAAVPLGNGVLKVYWDRAAEDVAVKVIEPECIYPDPCAKDLDEASYVAIRNIYSEDQAERIFDGSGEMGKIDLDKAAKVISADEDMGAIEQGTEHRPERIEAWEVYYEFAERLFIYSGDQVLFDGENPTPGPRYPIFLFQLHKQSKGFWGTGMVPLVSALQDYINRTRTRIAIHEVFTVNPVYWADDPSIELDVSPGAINRILQGSVVNALRPPALSAEVFQSLETAKHDFDVLFGTPEITRGIRPIGTTSGVSLEVLQQAAQVRMTGPVRNWMYILRDMWQCVLGLMQQNYAESRSIAMMAGGEAESIIIEPDALSELAPALNEDGSRVIDEETGEETWDTVPHRMQVVMATEGNLPMSEAAWAEIGLRLKQLPNDQGGAGIIDDEGLLDLLKFPGRDALKERKMALLAAQQEGQMAAAQMQQQAAGQQQAAQLEQQLAQALPPEMVDAIQSIKSGTGELGEAELQEMLQMLPENLRQMVMAYLQLEPGMAMS